MLPHIVIVVLFLLVSYWHCSPVLKAKALQGHDVTNGLGMVNESPGFNETHEEKMLGTKSMFGSMPIYQISMTRTNDPGQVMYNVLSVIPNCFLLSP